MVRVSTVASEYSFVDWLEFGMLVYTFTLFSCKINIMIRTTWIHYKTKLITLTCTLENCVTVHHAPNITDIILPTSHSKRLPCRHIYTENWAYNDMINLLL